jgi:hypothetical protein
MTTKVIINETLKEIVIEAFIAGRKAVNTRDPIDEIDAEEYFKDTYGEIKEAENE